MHLNMHYVSALFVCNILLLDGLVLVKAHFTVARFVMWVYVGRVWAVGLVTRLTSDQYTSVKPTPSSSFRQQIVTSITKNRNRLTD